MSNTIPIPPPSIHTNVVEFSLPFGKIGALNWYEALMDLQFTREARAAMRDVWEWEQTSNQYREQEEAPVQAAKVARAKATSAVVGDNLCARCGNVRPSPRFAKYCSSACSKAVDRAKEKAMRDAAAAVGWKAPRTCVICACSFTPVTMPQKTCSADCRRVMINASYKKYKSKKAEVMA